MAGAGWWTRMRRIIVPIRSRLISRDAVAIYISHEELSLVILLVTRPPSWPRRSLCCSPIVVGTLYERDCLYIDRGRGGLHCVKPTRDGNQLSERFGRVNARYSAR